ncbi:MAG: tyrosine--tRNA ligase [Chloroflexi bacterium AL-W]|nr:tyrosine--tRNA ligase [Chloroflexi bacterium AL-N1]NOK65684.1 tyrosine--tRNA ligase [Chloroflexi bacterium AL-N10]NOK74375.1 tyrosine--tRNA ligase [Chloroflexi bacterium AL-N5]NOK80717.1 tyrosine--tRNA ligase [Chloroflexi bacterium AL-W]NOK88633.1 tyrosine--tRNA ligase [Chloroflexi bacterium AL-N15]
MDSIDQLLTRGVAEVLVEQELRKKLQSGRPLRLKQGFDPSRPDMHIGNAVGLRKLRKFQEHGHQVVLIVGDWTAQIGDPSGRDETRPRLTADIVRENATTYMEQFFRVVERSQTEVRWQSEWYGDFNLERALDLAGRFTLAQMLAHETFRNRYEAGQPLTILELMYPMLQGYDSVAIQSDVEFGGTDQKFNNLAGRQLMEQMGMMPQDILLVPLIPGTDGRKMGKSFDNTIDITMSPFEMYSKVMAMSDDVLPVYFKVLTDVPMEEISAMQEAMTTGSVNPKNLKMQLAREVVTQFYNADDAQQSEAEWTKRFSARELPSDMPEHVIDQAVNIIDLMIATQLASSKSEARRLIDGGGVRVEGNKVEDYALSIEPDRAVVVQVGRRKFVRVCGS